MSSSILEQPAWPRVYPLTWGYRAFMWGFGALFLLGGLGGLGAVLVIPPTPGQPAARLVVAVVAALAALFGAYMLAGALRTRLVLTAEAITYTAALTRRAARKAAIAGWRIVPGRQGNPPTLILRPRATAARSLRIPLMFRTDAAFTAWLADLADDDAAKARAIAAARQRAEAAIAATPAYGATPEARLARLRLARRIVAALSVIAAGAALWAAVYPVPYRAAIGTNVVLPFLALILVPASRGLIRLVGPPEEARPKLAALLIAPGVALTFLSVQQFWYHILDWQRAGAIALVGGALFLALMAAVDQGVLRQRTGLLLLVPGALGYAFGVALQVNNVFDHGSPAVYRVAVLSRSVSHGRSTSWSLRLARWGPARSGGNVTVTPELYSWSPPEHRVCVRLHPGALHIAWYAVVYCNLYERNLAEATALPQLRRRAAAGDIAAARRIGIDRIRGLGVARDFAAARRRLLPAAAAGDPVAAWALGSMRQHGLGVPRDDARAAVWFARGAAAGEPRAETDLGYLYAFGRGVPRDPARAVAWYRQAARAGNALAAWNLGLFYRDGYGVPASPAHAVRLWMRAARGGYLPAMDALAGAYARGWGVAANPGWALAWTRAAAASGSAPAMRRLAAIALHGTGARSDRQNAYYWLALADREDPHGASGTAAFRARAAAALSGPQRAHLDRMVARWWAWPVVVPTQPAR